MSQRETVRSGVITEMVPSKVLEYVNALCAFAANSPEVQASPVLSQALLDLTGAAAQMDEQLSHKTNLHRGAPGGHQGARRAARAR